MTALVRDRISWLLYAQQGAYGYFLYGITPAVGLLREELGMSRTVAGLFGPALAVGTVAGGAVYPVLARRARPSTVLAASLTGLAAAVVVLCLMRSVPGILAAAGLAAFFSNLLVNGGLTALTARHGPVSGAAVSEATGFCVAVGFLAPLLIDTAIRTGLGWRAGLGVAAILTVAAAVATLRVRRAFDERPPAVVAAPPTGRLPGRYWLAWACVIAVGSVETCMTLWAPEHLRERVGLGPGPAAAGISALLAGMVAGRLAGGRLAARFRTEPLLCTALAVATAGFGVFWLATTPVLAMAGLLCCGLGMSLHFPLSITLSTKNSAGQPALAMSRNAYATALGLGAVPFLVGALADQAGMRAAFLLAPLCLAAAALAVMRLSRPEQETRAAATPLPVSVTA
jgi:predicted MFS family arabinose efflux permease